MKIDRLIGITMYLLNRQTVSAGELAKRFEVSRRTILRDMEILEQAGIPITSTMGSNGGFEILDTFRLSKRLTTEADYRNILFSLQTVCTATDRPGLSDTAEKLAAPGMAADAAEEQTVFIDFGTAKEQEHIQQYLRVLENAIETKSVAAFCYTDAGGRQSFRKAQPLALSYQWYGWYLLAFCLTRQQSPSAENAPCDIKAYRLFKLCRITDLVILDETFSTVHPPAAKLLRTLQENDTRHYLDITLKCRGAVLIPVLEYLNGRVTEELENGDFLLSLRLPEEERHWFSLLAGFGNQVEVLSPQSLRERLLRLGNDLSGLYSPDHS